MKLVLPTNYTSNNIANLWSGAKIGQTPFFLFVTDKDINTATHIVSLEFAY